MLAQTCSTSLSLLGHSCPAITMNVYQHIRRDRVAGAAVNDWEPIPTPPDRPPACPRHLVGAARTAWRRLAPALHAKGLLTRWDVELLASYCVALMQERHAFEEWEDDGFAVTITTAQGRIRHPALAAMREAHATMLSISKRFGFMPSDRAGIRNPERPKASKDAILRPRRVHDPEPSGPTDPRSER